MDTSQSNRGTQGHHPPYVNTTVVDLGMVLGLDES